MILRKCIAWAMALVLVFSLAGCAVEDDPAYIATGSAEQIEKLQASEEAARREEEAKRASEAGETLPEPTWGTPIPFEVTSYEYTGWELASGKLVVTVTDAWVVTHEDGIPEEGDIYPYDTNLYMGEGWTEYLQYPEFIHEDGSFVEGVFLILVDITVENHDAVLNDNWAESYGDPYLFQLEFIKLTEVKFDRKWRANYSSLYGEAHDEEKMTIHLEPGESVDMTVGFLVGDKWDGSTRDLSVLAVGCEQTPEGFVKIPLGLSNEGIEW